MKEQDTESGLADSDKAAPDHLPKPTYWPFFMATGLMFTGLGLLTSWIISLTGGLVFFISLFRWINILRHEGRDSR